MTKLELNAIVTMALVDKDFKKAVLNGKRRESLEAFKLPDRVRNQVLEIDAHDIHQFIYKLNEIVNQPHM